MAADSKLNPIVNAANVAGEKKQNLYALELAQKRFVVGSDEYKAIEAQKAEILGTSSTKKSMQDASPEVEQKTATTSTNTASTYVENLDYKKTSGSNVLNSYRSYTYNFTLAALDADSANDPTNYRGKQLERVVLTSKGKGNRGKISSITLTDEQKKKIGLTAYGETDEEYDSSVAQLTAQAGVGLVEEFNTSSPGRFDMYIDELTIDSTISAGSANGLSLANGMTFTVVEPYSMNGFLEALQVAAVSAGYPNYNASSYVLLIEFVGYPDNQDLPNPQQLTKHARYFPIKFSTVDIEVNEKGTIYKCQLTTINDRAFGNPNKLKATVNMKGGTVYEILTDLMSQLNKQIAQSDDHSKSGNQTKHDTYKIAFPAWDKKDGLVFNSAKDAEQPIAKAKIADNLKDSVLFSFLNPGNNTTQDAYGGKTKPKPTPAEQTDSPEKNKANPYTSHAQVNVSDQTNIHEIISSVIRDSEYTKNILKDPQSHIDKSGMIDYFMIRIDVKDLKEIDEHSKKPFQEFTYVVHPYKVHFSKIPGFEALPIDWKNLNPEVSRAYNYIYMGKNVDITNFKLEYNNLYYEAIAMMNGNTGQPARRNSASSNGDPQVVVNKDNTENKLASQSPTPVLRTAPEQTLVIVNNTPNAGQPQDSAYYAMARTFHNAVIQNKVALTTAEIEIIGDPYYLSTSGIGNYDPKIDEKETNTTVDGEVLTNRGQVQIAITFNNPIDYNTLEQGGTMYFDAKKVPFGGIFMVSTLRSVFKDGHFKQTLSLIRQPGQYAEDGSVRPVALSSAISTIPNPENESIAINPLTPGSTAQAGGIAASLVGGVRPNSFDLQSTLGRGFPNPGLPGVPSNFTNAVGGLGGTSNPVLNQVSGAVANGLGLQTANGSALFGGAIPGGVDQLASGIRMQASGLIGLGQSTLGSAINLINIGNSLNNRYLAGQSAFIAGSVSNEVFRDAGLSPLVSSMASRLVSQQAATAVAKTGILGSGIGINSQKNINALLAASSALGKAEQIASINPQSYVQGLTSQKINSALNMSPKDQAGVLGLASAAANESVNSAIRGIPTSLNSVGSYNNSLNGLTGVPTNYSGLIGGNPINPQSLAEQVGINTSQLSGLSNSFSSLISTEISNIVNALPTGVNLQTAVAQGVILDNLSVDTLPNLPPTAPYTVAPGTTSDLSTNQPSVDVNNLILPRTSEVLFDNGVNSLNQQNANMNITYGAGQTQFYGADLIITGNKLSQYMSGLPSLTGYAGSVESSQASINAVTGGFLGNPSSADLSSSVVTQFGSTAALSPLQKLVGG